MADEYTFDDWINDEEDFYQVYVPFIDDTIELGRTGNYPNYLFHKGDIRESEYQKIREAQKNAYDIVLNYHSSKHLNQLFKTLAIAPNRSDFLNHRKKIIESELSSANPKKLDAIYAGEWSALRLDPRSFKKIMERHKKGLEPLKLRGIEEKCLNLFGPYPHESDFTIANIRYETDEHFKLTILYRELLAVRKELEKSEDQVFSTNSRPADLSEKITTREIYQQYHALYQDGQGMKQFHAYKKVENWLLKELGFTKDEIKQKWNITLEADAFTRSARNNRS